MAAEFEQWPDCYKRLAGKITQNKPRYAWLVENGKAQGGGLAFLKFDPSAGMFVWTEHWSEALQFSRRQDAELVAQECEEAWAIVEHAFEC